MYSCVFIASLHALEGSTHTQTRWTDCQQQLQTDLYNCTNIYFHEAPSIQVTASQSFYTINSFTFTSMQKKIVVKHKSKMFKIETFYSYFCKILLSHVHKSVCRSELLHICLCE